MARIDSIEKGGRTEKLNDIQLLSIIAFSITRVREHTR